jgi:hypothetical protein
MYVHLYLRREATLSPNGKSAEFCVSPDRMTFMQQIGVLPADHSVA